MARLERLILVAENRKKIKPIHIKYLKPLYKKILRRYSIRISGDTVEIGILAEDVKPDTIKYIEEHIGKVIEKRTIGTSKTDPIEAYVDLVKNQRYWEAHEALENLWSTNRRPILQGIIQVTAAQVKAQEGRLMSALRMLKRAKERYRIDILFDIKCLLRETIRVYITGKSNILRCFKRELV